MVVGTGGIGNIRDIGDPNDPRRGTSAPQQNGAPGLPPSDLTGGFDFDAWTRRQSGQSAPAAQGRPSFADMAAAISQQQEAYSGRVTDLNGVEQLPTSTREQWTDREAQVAAQRSENNYQIAQQIQSYELNQQADEIFKLTEKRVTPQQAGQVSALLNSGLNIDLPTAVAAVQNNGRGSNAMAGLLASQNQRTEPEPPDREAREAVKALGIEYSLDQLGGDSGRNNAATAPRDDSDYELRQSSFEDSYRAGQSASRQLDRGETREANAADGKGKRINGRANPFQKEGQGALTPFSVPVIVGDPGQGRGGATTQVITTGFDQGRPTTVMDPSNSRVVLLNPAAELPADFANSAGYTVQRVKEQDQTGSYSKTPDVPVRDTALDVFEPDAYDRDGNLLPQQRVNTGFAAQDDPAYTRRTPENGNNFARDGRRPVSVTNSAPKYVDSRPMTLGQAMKKLLGDNTTPISTFRPEDTVVIDANSGSSLEPGVYTRNPDGSANTPLFELKNQKDSDWQAGVTAYRVGSPGMYSSDFYGQAQDLIQQATGGRPVVDPIQDGEAALDFELADAATREASTKERTRTVGGVRPVVGEKVAMYDEAVRNAQAQALLDSFSPEMLGGYYGDFTGGEQAVIGRNGVRVSPAAAVTGDSKNAFMAMISMLAKGGGLPVDRDGSVLVDAPAARDTSGVYGPNRPGRIGPNERPAGTSLAPEGLAAFPAGSLDALQAELEELGGVRRAEAQSNRVSQRGNWKKELPRAEKQNQTAIAQAEDGRRLAQDAYRQASLEAAQSPSVVAQNEAAFEAYENKVQAETERAYAVSEQNTHSPQSVDTGVMNTDDVSMLNAPEPPVIRDEPTPRQQQIAASAPAAATNSVADDRGMNFLREFMGRARRNPMRTAAAAAGTGLGVLGALPYDPREGE